MVAKLQAVAAKVADSDRAGVALVEMAKAYPRSEFHGYDIAKTALTARQKCVKGGVEEHYVT